MFMGFRMEIKGNVSYEEPPQRRSRYRRFKILQGLSVFIGVNGVYRCIGVYRYLTESIDVHGFSEVN